MLSDPMSTLSRRELAMRWIGRTLSGRYVLERLIGLGGMGAVFAGRHQDLDRPVAIKTVLPGMVLARGGERLLREAREAARVGGRGVVDVLDVAIDDAVGPYLVMELLEGETLAEHLAEHAPLSPKRALTLLGPVLETLALLHDADLVHRDLKPQNIMLAEEDEQLTPKLLDFGLARRMTSSDSAAITQSGAIVGTPRYMAPEQARAETVDHRTDLYAMGAILYFALGGTKPYDGFAASEEVIELVLAGGPPPLSQVAPHVSVAAGRLVSKAMASDPEKRFANARVMLEALGDGTETAVAHDLSMTLPEPSEASEPASEVAYGPALIGGIGALVFFAVGLIYAFVYAPEPSPSATTASPDAGSPSIVEPLENSPVADIPEVSEPPRRQTPDAGASTAISGPVPRAQETEPLEDEPLEGRRRRVVHDPDRGPAHRPDEPNDPEYEGRGGVFRVDDF